MDILPNGDGAPLRSGYAALASIEKEPTPIEKLANVMAKWGTKGVTYLLIPDGLKHSQEYDSRIPQAVESDQATAMDERHSLGTVKDGVIEWNEE